MSLGCAARGWPALTAGDLRLRSPCPWVSCSSDCAAYGVPQLDCICSSMALWQSQPQHSFAECIDGSAGRLLAGLPVVTVLECFLATYLFTVCTASKVTSVSTALNTLGWNVTDQTFHHIYTQESQLQYQQGTSLTQPQLCALAKTGWTSTSLQTWSLA